jgi:hypothetical protein
VSTNDEVGRLEVRLEQAPILISIRVVRLDAEAAAVGEAQQYVTVWVDLYAVAHRTSRAETGELFRGALIIGPEIPPSLKPTPRTLKMESQITDLLGAGDVSNGVHLTKLEPSQDAPTSSPHRLALKSRQCSEDLVALGSGHSGSSEV